MATWVLGGGCFWCIEAALGQMKGVISVRPGYAGGHTEHPTYREVCGKRTGHAEVVEITIDPEIIPEEVLLRAFFVAHDPTQVGGQGHDIGPQYRSIVLLVEERQRSLLEGIMTEMEEVHDRPLATEVVDLDRFWPAEEEHHDYFARNPNQPYCVAVVSAKVAKVRRGFEAWLA